MNATHKFEKDETVSLIFSEMVDALSYLYLEFGIDDLTAYFTDIIRNTVSHSEAEGTYTTEYITSTVCASTDLLNTHIKLSNLLAKYNKLTNQN